MDIRYYFKPINFFEIQDGNYLKNKNSLGYLIEKNTSALTIENTPKVQIAIIGIADEINTFNKGTSAAPNKIRNFLYTLFNINQKLNIIDLGNLKKGAGKSDMYFAISDVIDYLNDLKITTIILGGGQDIGLGVTRAFKYNKFFQMSTVDPQIDLKKGRETYNSSNYITRILKDSPNIFNINFIGYQSYFVPQNVFDIVRRKQLSTMRLGQLREDISEIEPILRDSHFLSFDISSVRYQDAPGYYNGSPNGIYSEEACQISRYAGISNNIRVFGLFEVNPKMDKDNQTLKLAAQIIWYFLDGYSIRSYVNPGNDKSELIEYNVELEELNTPLVFYHHALTNRWWMQLEGIDNKRVFIACTESDYKMAANKEIPPKWLMFIRKIDLMSK
ncbi:MAG: formimidoylglutamase [Mariniphaga sp.]|nr:formimidoylglutamase [Mariniphaga sp.]